MFKLIATQNSKIKLNKFNILLTHLHLSYIQPKFAFTKIICRKKADN